MVSEKWPQTPTSLNVFELKQKMQPTSEAEIWRSFGGNQKVSLLKRLDAVMKAKGGHMKRLNFSMIILAFV